VCCAVWWAGRRQQWGGWGGGAVVLRGGRWRSKEGVRAAGNKVLGSAPARVSQARGRFSGVSRGGMGDGSRWRGGGRGPSVPYRPPLTTRANVGRYVAVNRTTGAATAWRRHVRNVAGEAVCHGPWGGGESPAGKPVCARRVGVLRANSAAHVCVMSA